MLPLNIKIMCENNNNNNLKMRVGANSQNAMDIIQHKFVGQQSILHDG
jgi:hypothetical protein